MKTNKDLNLNSEEKELLESYNKGEWEKFSDHENELKKFRELASDSLKKRQTNQYSNNKQGFN